MKKNSNTTGCQIVLGSVKMNLSKSSTLKMFSQVKLKSFTVCLVAGLATQLFDLKAHAQTQMGLLPQTAECQDFMDFAQGKISDSKYIGADRKPLELLKTSTLTVMKNGESLYQWYDTVSSPNKPNVMWSATKTITVTLIGRTIQLGKTFNGRPFTLQSKLSEFYPVELTNKTNPEERKKYEAITIENLVNMSANFNWNEFYDGDLKKSSFMPMLYLDGQNNMPLFAIQAPMNSEGPGQRWVYSGGNMNILMGILKKIWGEEYFDMPNKILFHPLGIFDARLETDVAGNFVGSSYAYLTATAMQKLGQMYLQGGVWNHQQILPAGWMTDAKELTPAVHNPNTKLEYIKLLGAQSQRMFWLNKDITQNGKVIYPQEMPQAPAGLFFAAGHYGQLIIMIPEHNVVITRTGYDLKYWDYIQPLSVKALKCVIPGYHENKVATLLPPSAEAQKNILQQVVDKVKEIGQMIGSLNYLNQVSLPSAMTSKEMCSFFFVTGVAEVLKDEELIPTYLARSGLPGILQKILTSNLRINVDRSEKSVTVEQWDRKWNELYNQEELTIISRSKSKIENSEHSQTGCLLQREDVSQERSPYIKM